MSKEVNFSDRTIPKRDDHSWTDRPGAVVYYDEARTVKVKDLTVHVCSRCGLALVMRPEHIHDLPPCQEKRGQEEQR